MTHAAGKRDVGLLRRTTVLAFLALSGLVAAQLASAQTRGVVEIDQQVATLEAELAALREERQAAVDLARSPDVGSEAAEDVAEGAEDVAEAAEVARQTFPPGWLKLGGAMRVNYVRGSYTDTGSSPNRGGNGGNFELDTFRVNADLNYQGLTGKLEYRWYDGVNFLHTGWLGYEFDNGDELQVGLNRVPFGPGPYGVSQSWFYDQHYYLGLSDDMDTGAKYVFSRGNYAFDLALYAGDGGSWNGASRDSARYSYDAVRWNGAIAQDGTVLSDQPTNGYSESGQANARVIYQIPGATGSTDLGLSLQLGLLDGVGTDDGWHWAASAHMVNRMGAFTLASQLTRVEYRIDGDNPLGANDLIPMGAYDFAWPAAARAWVPAVSLSYQYDTPGLFWLDYVMPYIEYSSVVKDVDGYNDSQLVTLGAAWSRGGWYIYTDLAFASGNLFVGDDGDAYGNLFDGVGDWGVTGNDRWNYRFNVNFGYYF